jgi:hypothetical protein
VVRIEFTISFRTRQRRKSGSNWAPQAISMALDFQMMLDRLELDFGVFKKTWRSLIGDEVGLQRSSREIYAIKQRLFMSIAILQVS